MEIISVAEDTALPSINEVYIDPNPVDIGDTLTVRVDVTDD